MKFNEDVKKHGIELKKEKETVSQEELLDAILHHVSKRKALGSALTYDGKFHYKEFFGYKQEVFLHPFSYKKTLVTQDKSKGKRNNASRVAISFPAPLEAVKYGYKSKTATFEGRCYFFEEVKDFGGKKVGYIWGLIKEKEPFDNMLYGFAKKSSSSGKRCLREE